MLKAGVIMEKKLLLWSFVAVGLLILMHGCDNMSAEVSNGETLYRAKCSSCHNIIIPTHHNKEKWHRYIDKYGQEMTTEEKQVVLQYLANSG
jgi:hypothetical protein